MVLTYRNVQTGRVAEVQEATEVRQTQGDKPAIHAQRTINKMDASKRWERMTDPGKIKKAQEAWQDKQEASRPRRLSPTPVYVVNQEAEKREKVRVRSDKPTQADPKAEWVEYARDQGIEKADELTKADLVELLGSQDVVEEEPGSA